MKRGEPDRSSVKEETQRFPHHTPFIVKLIQNQLLLTRLRNQMDGLPLQQLDYIMIPSQTL